MYERQGDIIEEKLYNNMINEISWIECDGGPHILIESRYLKIWKGETDEEFEKSKQYYEEAGLIEDYIGELKIGSGKCLIIREEVTVSTWISDNNLSGFLVGVNYVSEEYADEGIKSNALLNELNKIPEEQFVDTNLTFQVRDKDLYLFAACDFGNDWLYNYCKLNLLPGNYRIKMKEEFIFDGSSFMLFKFSILMNETDK
ncbi:MAG: immunity 21 family protein [Lachnospiraceae bacterium]|nr:immunity 21 family protein [Lachnospiraceae bacterium]